MVTAKTRQNKKATKAKSKRKTTKKTAKKNAEKITNQAAAKKSAKKKRKTKTVTKKTGVGAKKKASAGQSNRFVTIASDSNGMAQVPLGPGLQELAMRWRYTLSRRLRWKRSSRAAMQKEAHKALKKLLDSDDQLDFLSEANVIEIQVPFRSERIGWEGRVAPWEFLISSSVTQVRKKTELSEKEPPTLVRWLQTNRLALPPMDQPRVLYVECAPGQLSHHYEFTTERASLQQIFGNGVKTCINPTISELRQVIRRTRPSIIHIAGIDNNQAKELLQDENNLPPDWMPSKRESIKEHFDDRDGIVFAADDPNDQLGLQPIGAESVAQVLNSGTGPLHLVTANVYHSASRICALAVAEGAGLAIGFQDTVRDSLAEVFLQDFYKSWKKNGDPLPVFVSALDTTRSSGSLSGTGIVLWSGTSLLDGATQRVSQDRQRRYKTREKVLDINGLRKQKSLKVTIKVRDRLNYSLLHNDSGGLFKEFKIEKPSGVLKDVRIEVVLYLGSESHPYGTRIDLTEDKTHIENKVKIPLTSSIIRTVSEPLRTSLSVTVAVGELVVHEDTYRVTLLPADEWKDTDADRIWLPSFVLPRDQAIETIIDRAQKHLVTLADDRFRGFDGYQSIDEEDQKTFSAVDDQVRAIWSTVANDLGIRYINPPPSYSIASQRLRTPTQIVRSGRGTCIDLALLLASSLEYIDIYPVIFLLEGHAFAGYWRSEEGYEEFVNAQQRVDDETMRDSIGSESGAPWILPSDSYEEIINEIKKSIYTPLKLLASLTMEVFGQRFKMPKKNLKNDLTFTP